MPIKFDMLAGEGDYKNLDSVEIWYGCICSTSYCSKRSAGINYLAMERKQKNCLR